MKIIGTCTFILFFTSVAFAQSSLQVIPHYPASAFVVNRLLPFVIGGDEEARVMHAEVRPFGACGTLIDPYFPNIFHLYCRETANVDVDILVIDGAGDETQLRLENLSVVIQRTPRDSFDSAIREAASREEL